MLTAFNSQKFKFWSFISMFLLVFVHAYNLNDNYLQPFTQPYETLTFTSFTEYFLANGIFRFRIPMLFIISGYLFALGDTINHKKRVGKRVKSLLYPYLFWSAFGLLLTYFLEMFDYSKSIVAATSMVQIDGTRNLLHQYHWYEILVRWIFFPVSYQLWFIRVLIMYNLSYPAIKWCVLHPKVKYVFFTIVLILWLSTASFILFEGEGLLFFSIGIWIQKTNFNIDVPTKNLKPKIWGIIFISLAFIKTIIAFKGHFEGVFPLLLLLHKLTVFSGLVTAWFGCNSLVNYAIKKQWFMNLTSFAFMIYVLHAPIVVYINKMALTHFNYYYNYRILIFVIEPILIIAIAVLIGFVLRKFQPKLYLFLTGGRGTK